MIKSPKNLLLLAILTLVIASCAPLVRHEGPPRVEYSQLREGNTFGQSFLARYRGLMGVAVYLKPSGETNGKLTLHLRAGPNDNADLAVAELSLNEISTPGYYSLTFLPQDISANQDYYLSLETSEINEVSVGIAPAESYLNGSFYQDGEPKEAQLAFKLIYDPLQAIIGVFQLLPSWLGLLVAAAFLLLLPGWALLSASLSIWKTAHWGEKAGLAIGASLAIYPLLFLWTDLVGLHLGPGYAWLPGLAGLVSLVWRYRTRLLAVQVRSSKIRTWLYNWQPWGDIALLAVLALVFAARFWVIRNLDAPLWGDSYQHTVIAQLMTEHGGLFTSWLPYAELSTFTYHFGFHTLAANIAWISGQSTPQAVLWSGQVLNALAALCLYPLATRLGSNRWSGLAAVLLAGLLLPMPMEYTNWGRYTQLAGQVILPVALYLLWHLLEAEQASFRLIVLASLMLCSFSGPH